MLFFINTNNQIKLYITNKGNQVAHINENDIPSFLANLHNEPPEILKGGAWCIEVDITRDDEVDIGFMGSTIDEILDAVIGDEEDCENCPNKNTCDEDNDNEEDNEGEEWKDK